MQTFDEQERNVRHDLTHQHRRKIPALTGIRGVAAMWVVLLHASFAGKVLGVLPDHLPVIDTGYVGVDLFFILSGFVLMLTYGEAVSAGWSGMRDFAVGRVFRILPLHWTVLLLFLAVFPLIGDRWLTVEPHSAVNFLASASLLQIAVHRSTVWNMPAWSLSAEWLCYFFFPAAAAVLIRTTSKTALSVIVVGPLMLLGLIAVTHHHPVTLNMMNRDGIARCGAEMVAGAALYRLCALHPPGRRAGDRMALAGLVLLALAMFGSYAVLACLPGFVLLVAACYASSPIASTLFGNPAVHRLGEVSFSIYLLHWLLFEVAVHTARSWLPGPRFLAVVLPPLAVIPLAWLTWRWVEVPGQAAGRRVVAWLRARDAARAAPATSSSR